MADSDEFHPPEAAHRLDYDAERNEWTSMKREIRVGKDMFAQGDNVGCIIVKDLADGQAYVLKKSFSRNVSNTEIYEQCKIQSIACILAEKFNTLLPPYTVRFLPMFVYILAMRPGQPCVIVEPVVRNHKKALARLSHGSPAERDTIDAFEHFTFHISKQTFLLRDPLRISDGRWTEPEFHSSDGVFGGASNKGEAALQLFLVKHADNQVCRQLKLPELGHGDEGLHEEDDDQDGIPPQEETPPMSPVQAPTSKPPSAPPPPAQNCVTGLGIVASKGVEGGLGEGIYVHSIVKDSPAEASDLFRVGDRIIMVDDRPVSTHTVEQVRGMLSGQAGKTARISYEREGYGHTLKASLPRAEGRVVDGAFRRVDQPDYDPAQDPMAPLFPVIQPIQNAAVSLSDILSKAPDFMKKKEEEETLRLTEEDVLKARQLEAQSGTIGSGVEPRIGMVVSMLPKYRSRGRGRITEIDEEGGYVAVRWENGSVDPCLQYKGDYFLRKVLL